MSKLTDYSKFDNLSLSDSSDEESPVPPNLPSFSSPNQPLSVDAVFESAGDLFNNKQPTLALRTFHKFLNELSSSSSPSSKQQPPPSTTAKWQPSNHPSPIMVSSEQLLYLYVNMAAIYYDQRDYGNMFKYAAAGVSVVRNNAYMMRRGSDCSLSLDVILLRSKAFFFAGKANLCSVEGSLGGGESTIRPLLLRAKSSFKSAEESLRGVDFSEESLRKFKDSVISNFDKTSALLEEFSPPKNFTKGEGNGKEGNFKAGDRREVLKASFAEGEARITKGHFDAALKIFEYVLGGCDELQKKEGGDDVVDVEVLAVKCLIKISTVRGKMGDAVSQYKVMKDAAARCGGGDAFGNIGGVGGLWRRAGLLGLRVNDLKGAEESFEQALKSLGYQQSYEDDDDDDDDEVWGKDEEVYELDSDGNIVKPTTSSKESKSKNEVKDHWAVVGNLASLAGVRCSQRLYDKALPTIKSAERILTSHKSSLSVKSTYKALVLTVKEVLGDCYAGMGEFEKASGHVKTCIELAKELEEWERAANGHESLAHMDSRLRPSNSFPTPNEKTSWTSAAVNYMQSGSCLRAGQTYLRIASLTKSGLEENTTRSEDQGRVEDEKRDVIKFLRCAKKSFGEGRNKTTPSDSSSSSNSRLECLRGEFEASKALAFFLQTCFDFDSGDSVDVDNAVDAFFQCRMVAGLVCQAMGISLGDKRLASQLELESVGRVCYEWGSCLVKRRSGGDLVMAAVAFEEARVVWEGGNEGGRFSKHVGMARRMKEMVEKRGERG